MGTVRLVVPPKKLWINLLDLFMNWRAKFGSNVHITAAGWDQMLMNITSLL